MRAMMRAHGATDETHAAEDHHPSDISLQLSPGELEARAPSQGEPPSYDELEGPAVIITTYRLLVSGLLICLGISKAALSYKGSTVAPTTLDPLLCVSGIFTLYWLGPLEALRPKVMPWMFHRDLGLAFRERLRSWRKPNRPVSNGGSVSSGAIGTEARPKIRVAVTLHRLTSSMLLLAFGITKAVLGYKGNVIAGTTLDWLVGILLTLVLYWVGLLEWSRPGVAPWYFHRDLLSGDEEIEELDPADYVDHEKNVLLHEFPKYPIKITGYRILNTVIILAFGLSKTALSYMGKSIAPITLEWIMGVVAALILYWIGFYEAPRTNVYPTFFQKDHSEVVGFPSFHVVVGAFIAAIHLFVTSEFVAQLLERSATDNGVDTACRIIMLVWFGLSLFVLLALVANALWVGRFPNTELYPWAFGWYFTYFVLIILLSMLKGIGGYHPPATGDDHEDKPGWTFCVSIVFFTYCW